MSEQQSTHVSLDRLPIKLEGASNYATWIMYVMAALMGQGLYGHVNGDIPRPTPTVIVAGATPDTKLVDEWTRKDDKAKSIIVLGVTPPMLHHLVGQATAKQMWDKLATQCRKKDLATRLGLYQQLFNSRLVDADSVDKHLSTMSNIRSQMADIGKPIDDEMAAVALLMSVPQDQPRWEMWLHSVTAAGNDLTWDGVAASMRAEANLQQQRDRVQANTATAAAYFVAIKGKQRPFCTHCNKRGHIKDTCWQLHPNLRTEHKEEHNFNFVDTGAENNGADSAVALLSHTSRQGSTTSPTISGLWHVDSGASGHLTGDRTWFTELSECPPIPVTTASHGKLMCTQRGTVALITPRGRINIKNVLFIPSVHVNLISVSCIIKSGYRVRFTEKSCTINTRHNKLVTRAVAHSNLFSVVASPLQSVTALSVTAGTSGGLDWKTAHTRMGHLSPSAMKTVFDKSMVLGVATPTIGSPADIDHCTGCLYGKAHRQPFPAGVAQRASRPLQLVHSDLCGPVHDILDKPKEGTPPPPHQYVLTFIDDYSREVWATVTTAKSGTAVLEQFRKYKVWAEKQTGFTIQTLRTDGGGEYINKQFDTYLSILGVNKQVTAAYTPQQNGVAERMNRTLLEATRSMLHASGLPLTYWHHALKTAVYLRNRSPTSALDGITPHHAWHGDKPDLSHLRTFGCRAYMHINKKKITSKLQPRSIPVIFIGYHTEAKAWRVYDPVGKQEHITRDLTFHENVSGATLLAPSPPASASAAVPAGGHSSLIGADSAAELVGIRQSILDVNHGQESESDQDDSDSEAEPVVPAPPAEAAVPAPSAASVSPASIIQSAESVVAAAPAPSVVAAVPVPSAAISPPASVSQPAPVNASNSSPPRQPRRRLTPAERELRNLASHNHLGNAEQPAAHSAFAAHVAESITEPLSYKEAARSPHRVQWELAMQEELDSIRANSTYELVPLPADRHAIGSKWVFKIKRHADGSIDRLKARLVAKGYSQQPGVDFTDTFAPVVRFSSLRAILAVAAAADYEIHQISTMTTLLAHINSSINPKNINQPTAGEPSSIQLPATSHP